MSAALGHAFGVVTNRGAHRYSQCSTDRRGSRGSPGAGPTFARMSELTPVAGWRKIAMWLAAALLWLVVIIVTAQGEAFHWRWWLEVIVAVIVTISAIALQRHPTQR